MNNLSFQSILNEAYIPWSRLAGGLLKNLSGLQIEEPLVKEFKKLSDQLGGSVFVFDSLTKTIKVIDWTKMSKQSMEIVLRSSRVRTELLEILRLNNIDITKPTVRSTLTGIYKMLADSYVNSANKVVTRSKISTDDLTYSQSFIKGLTTTQAPFLFSRYIMRNLPIPGVRSLIRNYTTKLSKDEMKRMGMWFFSGIGDAKSVSDIFKKHNFPKALVNVSGQVFSKWLFWSTAFTLTNLLLDMGKDVNQRVYKTHLDAWIDRLSRSTEAASLGWLFPVKVVYDQLIGPLAVGGLIDFQSKQFQDKLKTLKSKSEKNVKNIENNLVKTKSKFSNLQQKSKIDSIKQNSPISDTTKPKPKFDSNF
jgi:hypothetical protein